MKYLWGGANGLPCLLETMTGSGHRFWVAFSSSDLFVWVTVVHRGRRLEKLSLMMLSGLLLVRNAEVKCLLAWEAEYSSNSCLKTSDQWLVTRDMRHKPCLPERDVNTFIPVGFARSDSKDSFERGWYPKRIGGPAQDIWVQINTTSWGFA